MCSRRSPRASDKTVSAWAEGRLERAGSWSTASHTLTFPSMPSMADVTLTMGTGLTGPFSFGVSAKGEGPAGTCGFPVWRFLDLCPCTGVLNLSHCASRQHWRDWLWHCVGRSAPPSGLGSRWLGAPEFRVRATWATGEKGFKRADQEENRTTLAS